ncbi:MAG: hypothetical protein CM1200mP28_17270 [Deltaproteobacteria bacterium]|nr:MAG: hypothetical protein CM1200mP28_17270 [Deltaproteobacteria bacterium]
MGVFVPVAPFKEIQVGSIFSISSIQQLFLLGGLAIAVGVFTYSKRVMMTVGSELITLTPLQPGWQLWPILLFSFFLPPKGLNSFWQICLFQPFPRSSIKLSGVVGA